MSGERSSPPAENVPSEWVEIVREMVQREGRAVHAGPENKILIQSINTGRFCALNLPGNVTSFAREVERDFVIERILRPYPPGKLAGLNAGKV